MLREQRTADHQSPNPGWPAGLELNFAYLAGRTRLIGAHHHGPLRVQRPFYPEGEPCHVYLLHPPGGLVAGDSLAIHAHLGPQSHALLTTPAAGKVYRTNPSQQVQLQQTTLRVSAGATLEWLPQENIVFDGANAQQSTVVELEGNAQALAWEITCLGRPAGRQLFTQGRLDQRFEIWRDGAPLLLERTPLCGGPVLCSSWGLQGNTVLGTLLATCDDDQQQDLLEQLREQAQFSPLAFTRLPGLLIARYLGHSAEQARELFFSLWDVLRPVLLSRDACPPRIWRT